MAAPQFLLTGASSGIGAAIAARLAGSGRRVLAVGRNRGTLEALCGRLGAAVEPVVLDLEDGAAVEAFAQARLAARPALDGLIHCAGAMIPGELGAIAPEELERMLAVNFRAAFLLTNRLVPALVAARGQIVFVNSSAGRDAAAGRSAYAASKFALRALADAARLELNPRGVRVASIYPGRTATPVMESLYAQEGRAYDPGLLLQPDDVAAAVLSVIEAPEHAEITEICLRPRFKSY